MSSGPISERGLELLRDLVLERIGLYYDNGRCDSLMHRLEPLLAESGADSLLDYYFLLKYEDPDNREWLRVGSALTIRETYFWREPEQLVAVAREIVPHLLRSRPDRAVRIWHAGCATGEEPYSLAVALHALGRLNGEVEIVATDLDPQALARAELAEYGARSLRHLPADLRAYCFEPLGEGRARVAERVRRHVRFQQLNLMDVPRAVAMQGFDVIFCRNVFIYFSRRGIADAAKRFYDSLETPGHLFVASAESLLRVAVPYELVQVGSAFAYRKSAHE